MTFASRTTSRAIVESIAVRDGVATERHEATSRIPGVPGQDGVSRRAFPGSRDDLAPLFFRQLGELADERLQRRP
jgi:hypothetical protein